MTEGNNKFTIVFIKPDAINDGLVDQIMRDFAEAGLASVFCKPLELNWDQALFIYRDHLDNPNYRFAVKSLTEEEGCKTSLFFLLKRDAGDALKTAQEVKGRADRSGVRAKYRRYLWTELQERGITGDELETMLSRNRVHVSDSDNHVCYILGMLIDDLELRQLIKIDPELVGFIEGCGRDGSEFEGGKNNKERL